MAAAQSDESRGSLTCGGSPASTGAPVPGRLNLIKFWESNIGPSRGQGQGQASAQDESVARCIVERPSDARLAPAASRSKSDLLSEEEDASWGAGGASSSGQVVPASSPGVAALAEAPSARNELLPDCVRGELLNKLRRRRYLLGEAVEDATAGRAPPLLHADETLVLPPRDMSRWRADDQCGESDKAGSTTPESSVLLCPRRLDLERWEAVHCKLEPTPCLVPARAGAASCEFVSPKVSQWSEELSKASVGRSEGGSERCDPMTGMVNEVDGAAPREELPVILPRDSSWKLDAHLRELYGETGRTTLTAAESLAQLPRRLDLEPWEAMHGRSEPTVQTIAARTRITSTNCPSSDMSHWAESQSKASASCFDPESDTVHESRGSEHDHGRPPSIEVIDPDNVVTGHGAGMRGADAQRQNTEQTEETFVHIFPRRLDLEQWEAIHGRSELTVQTIVARARTSSKDVASSGMSHWAESESKASASCFVPESETVKQSRGSDHDHGRAPSSEMIDSYNVVGHGAGMDGADVLSQHMAHTEETVMQIFPRRLALEPWEEVHGNSRARTSFDERSVNCFDVSETYVPVHGKVRDVGGVVRGEIRYADPRACSAMEARFHVDSENVDPTCGTYQGISRDCAGENLKDIPLKAIQSPSQRGIETSSEVCKINAPVTRNGWALKANEGLGNAARAVERVPRIEHAPGRLDLEPWESVNGGGDELAMGGPSKHVKQQQRTKPSNGRLQSAFDAETKRLNATRPPGGEATLLANSTKASALGTKAPVVEKGWQHAPVIRERPDTTSQKGNENISPQGRRARSAKQLRPHTCLFPAKRTEESATRLAPEQPSFGIEDKPSVGGKSTGQERSVPTVNRPSIANLSVEAPNRAGITGAQQNIRQARAGAQGRLRRSTGERLSDCEAEHTEEAATWAVELKSESRLVPEVVETSFELSSEHAHITYASTTLPSRAQELGVEASPSSKQRPADDCAQMAEDVETRVARQATEEVFRLGLHPPGRIDPSLCDEWSGLLDCDGSMSMIRPHACHDNSLEVQEDSDDTGLVWSCMEALEAVAIEADLKASPPRIASSTASRRFAGSRLIVSPPSSAEAGCFKEAIGSCESSPAVSTSETPSVEEVCEAALIIDLWRLRGMRHAVSLPRIIVWPPTLETARLSETAQSRDAPVSTTSVQAASAKGGRSCSPEGRRSRPSYSEPQSPCASRISPVLSPATPENRRSPSTPKAKAADKAVLQPISEPSRLRLSIASTVNSPNSASPEPLEYMMLPYLHSLPCELVDKLRDNVEDQNRLLHKLRSHNRKLSRMRPPKLGLNECSEPEPELSDDSSACDGGSPRLAGGSSLLASPTPGGASPADDREPLEYILLPYLHSLPRDFADKLKANMEVVDNHVQYLRRRSRKLLDLFLEERKGDDVAREEDEADEPDNIEDPAEAAEPEEQDEAQAAASAAAARRESWSEGQTPLGDGHRTKHNAARRGSWSVGDAPSQEHLEGHCKSADAGVKRDGRSLRAQVAKPQPSTIQLAVEKLAADLQEWRQRRALGAGDAAGMQREGFLQRLGQMTCAEAAVMAAERRLRTMTLRAWEAEEICQDLVTSMRAEYTDVQRTRVKEEAQVCVAECLHRVVRAHLAADRRRSVAEAAVEVGTDGAERRRIEVSVQVRLARVEAAFQAAVGWHREAAATGACFVHLRSVLRAEAQAMRARADIVARTCEAVPPPPPRPSIGKQRHSVQRQRPATAR